MRTLTGIYSCEMEIKKSRFIARAAPVLQVEEALAFLEQAREPKANHNCWAYKIGPEYRFSDDGEPAGTAGRPVFTVIENKEFDNIIVVVTRYFGGIKLGAGGLVRAYSGVTASCLEQAPWRTIISIIKKQIKVPFNYLGKVYSLLEQYKLEKTGEEYGTEYVILEVLIPEEQAVPIEKELRDRSGGAAFFC
ncbi:MAG: YigZ family protein [bacterium]|nr:YigZ family protein [bacterium]